jgi:hypothetical protein
VRRKHGSPQPLVPFAMPPMVNPIIPRNHRQGDSLSIDASHNNWLTIRFSDSQISLRCVKAGVSICVETQHGLTACQPPSNSRSAFYADRWGQNSYNEKLTMTTNLYNTPKPTIMQIIVLIHFKYCRRRMVHSIDNVIEEPCYRGVVQPCGIMSVPICMPLKVT